MSLSDSDDMLVVHNVSKQFEIHERNVRRRVLENLTFSVRRGECVALDGPSGVGKSTLMRMIYGSYRTAFGQINVRTPHGYVDVASADPWTLIELRRSTLGYVSQFLRVLPRISALDIVAGPLLDRGVESAPARREAGAMLERLGVESSLWDLSPLTFSGGEQQRVNIARTFTSGYSVLLLDEPTASLDARNRELVLSVIREAMENGSAIVGIFHDRLAADAIVTRRVALTKVRHAS
ncbi:phosphonate C-P lyase system protein PhnL [Burkholderia cepacia]|uniref:phosphonate C-P lyase system protein PhnL n=1 Tax=Burkholderia cepacia TaxID=292 RepID=UPI002AB67D03|nr:phosphonate C-P lyase system protein PhnL [Burkholderia cepacia]